MLLKNSNLPICLNSKGGRNGIEGLQPSLCDRVYDTDGTSTACTTSSFFMPMYLEKENEMGNVRIRKLMPEEAFILMGMTPQDCQKCRDIGLSNSALYKATGNGLISQCVMLIMEHLHKALNDEEYICYDENFQQPA